jgi:hypothetical protein
MRGDGSFQLTLHKNLALTAALKEVAETRRVKLIAWQDPVYADELHEGMPRDLLRQKWDGVGFDAKFSTW